MNVYGFSYSTTGGAVGVDADPNVTPPVRVQNIPGQPTQALGSLHLARACVLDGTSLTIIAYVWDANTSKWLPIATVVAAVGVLNNIPAPAGTRMFFRVTVNTGAVTTYGLLFN